MYIPYGRQNISEEDIEAVVAVLRSDYLTQGPVVPQFEAAVANYCGAKHALAVNSATSALHIACLALGVGPGDIVWTTPISFVASANCALYCDAEVDFVDIDGGTYNMSVRALEEKLVKAEMCGRLPKVVIPVHLCGQSCDMAGINALSKKYGFRIIEDASHAIGGKYKGQPVGNCAYSDITVFSFHPVKIITTGEGGMAITNDNELAARMARLRSHGITRDVHLMENEPDGSWYYEQLDLGYNFRMTDMQAALGVSQFGKLDAFVAQRHRLASHYDSMFANLPVTRPFHAEDTYSAYHLYVVRMKLDKSTSHRETFEHMKASGIGVNLHYIPIYRHPHYAKTGRYNLNDFPEAEKYYSEAITIPLFPGLTEPQQDEVIKHFAAPIGFQTLF